MPQGAEDYTGNLPLMERIELLAYADFFIGVGSGLSWLADAAGCPVVLFSGFSMPAAEFDTPYRVINPLVCHGCYNDMTVDWLNPLCPRHHDTEREYECSVKIPPKMVISAIDRLREDLKNNL
jgi:autotransporter strand-loop-strand O-heptosyltransferase